MPALKFEVPDVVNTTADALVIGALVDGEGRVRAAPGLEALDKALGGKLDQVLSDVGATGKPGDLVRLSSMGAISAPTIVAIGLGNAEPNTETLRSGAGNAVRALAGLGSVAFALPATEVEAVRAVATGASLGAYAYDEFRSSTKDEAKAAVDTVAFLVDDPTDKTLVTTLARVAVVAEAVHLARDLVNRPPDALCPSEFVAVAAGRAEAFNLAITVLDEQELVDGGYGGIAGVGAGSARPPRLLRLDYKHPEATTTLALVGKGVTFDSGGLSIKPGKSMETMKMDMAGAAAVLAAIGAIAALELPVNVSAWMPLAENMPSGTAIRPSDVITQYGGKTVEVLNTDAEGRLLLADAIARSSEDEPDVLVDVATLTGAVISALGNRTVGVMANNESLRSEIVALAEAEGELMWPLPLPDHLKKGMSSGVADLKNIGDAAGGALSAGLFLQSFVGEGIRWAHLDIAGPAFNSEAAYGCTPKGGTGAAVPTLIALAEALA